MPARKKPAAKKTPVKKTVAKKKPAAKKVVDKAEPVLDSKTKDILYAISQLRGVTIQSRVSENCTRTARLTGDESEENLIKYIQRNNVYEVHGKLNGVSKAYSF